jgi:hypothetical protein
VRGVVGEAGAGVVAISRLWACARTGKDAKRLMVQGGAVIAHARPRQGERMTKCHVLGLEQQMQI